MATESTKKILAIGAHPDDVEFGCGGTLIKHVKNGDDVYLVLGSLGEKSGNEVLRKKEALMSANLMGAKKTYFLNLKDTFIMHDGITVNSLDRCLKKVNPKLVYVHSPKDYHQDHGNIAKSTLSASRYMEAGILFYESPSATIEFRPAAYSDISDTFKDKLKCLEKFDSQNNKEYMEKEAIIGLAKTRGNTIGVKYAEAFEVARLFNW